MRYFAEKRFFECDILPRTEYENGQMFLMA